MPIIAIILIRLGQLAGLLALWMGLQGIQPLISAVNDAVATGDWPWPKLCIRWGAVVGPVMLGGGMVVLLQIVLNRASRRASDLKKYKDEPWMINPMWASKHIRLNNHTAIIAFFLFLGFYLFLVIPLAFATEKAIFLILALIGGLFALVLFRIQWLNRIWNRSELRLSTLPGVIGGPFTGVVVLHQSFPSGTSFSIALKCDQTQASSRGRNRDIRIVTLWSSLIHMNRTLEGSPPNTTALPVSFAIPFECLPTEYGDSESTRWLLTVSEKEKIGTGATFEIPVCKTSESRPDFEFDEELIEEYLEKVDPLAVLRRYNFVETPLSRGLKRLEFTDYDGSIFSTMIGIILFFALVIAVIFYWATTWQVRLFGSLFPFLFMAMGIYAAIHMLFWKCSLETGNEKVDTTTDSELDEEETIETQVTGPGGSLKAESGIAGFRRTLLVSRDSTSELFCKLENRSQEKESWSIYLRAPNRDPLRLLSVLKSSAEAEAVQRWLAEQLEISSVQVTPEDGFV